MESKFNIWSILIFLVISALMATISCQKDKPSPKWDVNLLIPLVHDSIPLYDVLDQRFFQENADQSISLILDEELFKMNLDTLVSLPDTLLTFGLSLGFLPFPITLQPGDTVVNQTFVLPLDLQSDQIDNVLLKHVVLRTGDIVFETYNQSLSDLQVALEIETAYHPQSGNFFSVETVANNELFRKGFDIRDYHLNLTGPDNDTVNLMIYKVALIIHPDEPAAVTVYPQDSVALNVYFSNVVVNYAQGYFGHQNIEYGPEIYEVDFLSDLQARDISFEDAEIQLTISNTYGVDIDLQMETTKAINTATNDTVALNSPIIDSILSIAAATETGQNSGIIEPANYVFDFSNSNFPELFAINPNQIYYKLNIEANRNTDSTQLTNFFYNDFPVSVDLHARVNGGISFSELFHTNRMPWQGGEIELNEVKTGHVNIIVRNAFPFEFAMTLYLEDADSVVLDTLILNKFIEAGTLSETGFVQSPHQTILQIELSQSLKEHFPKVRFARYELWLNSAHEQPVNLHRNNYVSFKVVGDFEYLFNQK